MTPQPSCLGGDRRSRKLCHQCGREESLCPCPVFDSSLLFGEPTSLMLDDRTPVTRRTCDDCGMRVDGEHECPATTPLWSGWLWLVIFIPGALLAGWEIVRRAGA